MEEAHKRDGKWKDSKNDKINFYVDRVKRKKMGVSPEPEGFPDPAPGKEESDLEAELQRDALKNKAQKKEFRDL